MNIYEYDMLDITERQTRPKTSHDKMTAYVMAEYGVKEAHDRQGFYYKEKENTNAIQSWRQSKN